MIKKTLRKIVLFLDGLSYWKVLIILFIATIFSIPDFTVNETSKFQFIATNSSTATESSLKSSSELEVRAPSSYFFPGAWLPSKLLGLEILPMSIKICLSNKNKIFFDGVEKKSEEILDSAEGGAMSIKVSFVDSQNNFELYAPKDRIDCEVIDPQLGNANAFAPEIRSVMPLGRGLLVAENEKMVLKTPVYKMSYLDIGESNLNKQIVFDWQIYLRNFFVTLLGLGLIIELSSALLNFCKKR